ncbi:Autophagy-related protein 11 [Escovopsis weberi]|uniref:Autophagy-related protein 11 n=1 Tax=Escovopsis weberi TaxID=150374 RepID=A0A0M8N2K2_ESCWE|nr:Autophagy-related protein 11 [Escovopsis weberi]
MATQVLIAHTGQRLEVDTAQFSTLDEFKAWVARNSSVTIQHVVALNPQGRSIKLASLHAETEIYVYDIRVIRPSSPGGVQSLVSETPLPKRQPIDNAPNSIEDVQAIKSWQDLFKERRSWALRLVEDSERLSAVAQAQYHEMDVMIKCLDAAVANLELSIKQIEPKYNELKKWVTPTLLEHERLAATWENCLDLARSTPISPTLVHFMTRGQVDKPHPTLEDLIELETARKAGKLAPTAHRRFSDKAAELERAAARMYQALEALIADFDKLMARSYLERSAESPQLLQQIEASVKHFDSDYRTVVSYTSSQRDLAQASKAASTHTERLIPTLKKQVKELDDFVQCATKSRNAIAADSVTFMRNIADITSLHSGVRNHINVLNQSEDDMTTFDYLRLIQQLPYMYASFMAEAIRRREWIDKMKNDSSTLANEMALFQDEESKRRKKWQKMVGSMYGPGLDTNVMGLEVSLRGDDVSWPAIDKSELDEFLLALQERDTDPELLDDIVKLVADLHSPTRQQSKRVKAFKNGSVHEASLGRSGLMIRGDDELLRSLQDDKSRLENKLKTAESRVRRLEDLLHRQTQTSRPGSLFQGHERHDSSSSAKSHQFDNRRLSSEAPEPLLRKITQLENELREERERSVATQKDLETRATERDDIRDRFQEVNSTKKDLLENMEALKKEFMDERISLENEIKSLKARLEETEDDIEHFGESRENEKATYDERIQALEEELEQLNKTRKDDALRAQGQVEFLRKETNIQRQQLDASERKLQLAQEEARSGLRKLRLVEESAEQRLQTLQKLYDEIAPDATVPIDEADLAEALLSGAVDVIEKLRNSGSNASLLRTELDQAQSQTRELRRELSETKDRLSAEETSARHARENLAEEQARIAALENEVAEGREQLSQLRARLSDGETGSETLRKKLEKEEKKATELSEEIASRQSQMGSLEEEVRLYKEKLDTLQERMSALNSQFEVRDGRTKDLTQRLYSQNDRLARLLERVGFSVRREEGVMSINRIPRSDKLTNPNDSSDPGSSLRRSVTLGGRAMAESVDLDLLYWINDADPSAETEKYEAFMSKMGSFDTDLFSDTIYHRVKEAEHKARKWQREARAYRDKAHSVQKEAHNKIAFKNFKEGDLALFLPTRNQQAGAWAAFNVGFPHFFLREQDGHRLRDREWLVARISRIQERVVDLSKSLQASSEADPPDEENDNPFQLSDGLRWYLIDAQEDKAGAPATPGMGKSTVAATPVEATANIQTQMARGKGKRGESIASIEGINKTLSKSLESRRSSSGSKKALPFSIGGTALLKNSALASETNSLRAVPSETPIGASPPHGELLATPSIHDEPTAAAPAPASAGPSSSSSAAAAAAAAGPSSPPTSAGQHHREASGLDEAAGKEPELRRLPGQGNSSARTEWRRSIGWDQLWSIDYTYGTPSRPVRDS